MPQPPRLRILSGKRLTAQQDYYFLSNNYNLVDANTACAVGGNSTSAFLSWRLQATNACDVTLVWKSGYEAVSQYGISFK